MQNISYQSASVIVVSNYGRESSGQPKKFVLMGLTKTGKLSTFGGQRDGGEYNPKDTAAREMAEEALGVLGGQAAIRSMLRGLKPSSGTVSGHLTYVLPGKFYGENVPKKFRQIRFDANSHLDYSQKEMVDIVAVSVHSIKNKVLNGKPLQFKDNDGNWRSLRKTSEGAIKAAINAGHI